MGFSATKRDKKEIVQGSSLNISENKNSPVLAGEREQTLLSSGPQIPPPSFPT